jgi:ElaB/YqjD/DUF883 family membrane-anchored ribosome-binding protein
MKTHTPTAHTHSRTSHGHSNDTTHLIDDAKELLSATANVAGSKVVEARQRLMAAVASGKQKAITGARATDRVIRENPYQSIAIAAGVAVVAGYLLGRRGRRAGSEG